MGRWMSRWYGYNACYIFTVCNNAVLPVAVWLVHSVPTASKGIIIRIFQSIFSCSMAPLLQLYIQYSIDTITVVFLCQNSTSTQSWSVSCHSHSVAHAYSEWPVTKSMDSTYSTKLYQGTDPRCMHALIELWTSSCTYSLCTVTSSPS